MSISEHDIAYEQWLEALYEEHLIEEAIAEFTTERLQSFYTENPLIAEAPFRALNEARQLFAESHYSAAFVFASIAIETGIKTLLLKPIVYGLIHSDSTAQMVADLVVSQAGIDRFRGLLFQILLELVGIDLKTFTRTGCKPTLWEEILNSRTRRNQIVHRADMASEQETEQAISIASCILEVIFPDTIQQIGLHLRDNKIL